MKIAFILPAFPVFSETFILNEIFWLQKSGISGHIWYETKHKSKPFQPVASKIKYLKTHITPKVISSTLLITINNHLLFLFRNPIGYFKAIVFFLSVLSYENLRIFLKSGTLAKQIIDSGCTLIYVHYGDTSAILGIFCKYLCDLPCGIIFHTEFLFSQPKYIESKVSAADFVICKSNYSKRYIAKEGEIKKHALDKIHVLPTSGVDTHFFKLGFKSRSKTINLISVGRLEETKGFHLLINAVALLRKQNISARCTIIGDGSQRKMLENLIAKLRLKRYIMLPGSIGHTQKLVDHLKKANIFVLPSVIGESKNRDMQPNAIKEAMAMKLIVVTSKLGGIDEVIRSGENGYILKSTSPKQIARRVKIILNLSRKKTVFIQNQARKTILKSFNASRINNKLIKLFQGYSAKSWS